MWLSNCLQIWEIIFPLFYVRWRYKCKNHLIIIKINVGDFSGQLLCYDEELRATGELRKACSRRGTPLQPASRANTTSRLINLRRVMNSSVDLADYTIDAFLVTSDDEHQVGRLELSSSFLLLRHHRKIIRFILWNYRYYWGI